MGRLALSKPMPPLLPTAASAVALIAMDVGLAKQFALRGIAFPSALAGMMGIFATLVVTDLASPRLSNKMLASLAPGAELFTKWLPLFFVPSLVVLPLQAPPAPADLSRLLAITVGGWAASTVATAATVDAISKACRRGTPVTPSRIDFSPSPGGGRAEAKASRTALAPPPLSRRHSSSQLRT